MVLDILFPLLESIIIGLDHIHNPFVHGFTVGPTLNPFCLFNNILFIKYDLPVRYIPATEMTPNSDLNDFMTSSPCSVNVKTIK